MKPPQSSVRLEQKIMELGFMLCAERLLAAALAGICRCSFGCFQKAPKANKNGPAYRLVKLVRQPELHFSKWHEVFTFSYHAGTKLSDFKL